VDGPSIRLGNRAHLANVEPPGSPSLLHCQPNPVTSESSQQAVDSLAIPHDPRYAPLGDDGGCDLQFVPDQ